FAWDNYNRAGAGFWGHIHKVVDAAPGTYPYCFYSALVDSWQWYDTFRGGALINPMLQVGGKPTFEQYKITSFLTGYAPSAIVPQIFLRPVLEKAVALAGWKLEGDILSDPQFNLICLCTLRAINWVSGTHTAKPQITFNLADHLPAITVSKLLMALRNRFGWWYDVDRVNKIVRIRELKTVGVTNRKDMTRKASPVVTKTILEEQKIYGVHNSAGSSKLSLDGYEYKGELNVKGLLPAPSQAVSGHVYLVKMENNYYVCEGGENNVFTWEILSANTGDAVPDGATEEIRGDSLVSPIKQQYGIYGEYFPFIEGAVYWPTANDDQQANDIQLCFYYGIRNDFNNRPWPFASHHIYDAKALQVGTWSLALLAKDYAGNDIGLYHRNWKPFLDRLIAQEECEVELSLTRQEFMEMKFSDELIVDGMSYYVAKRKYVLPAKKGILRVVCECNRI
ncbi:MAG TPA: hypothetical protein VEB42_03310, partial [Chitinophagaceae bacterium]|nr:hypothetical protein [Chitinophagaceae bacterium]